MAAAVIAAAAEASELQPRLLSVAQEASAWFLALITRHLNARSRWLLSQASKGMLQCVADATQRVSITLHVHAGLDGAAWQRRLTAAEPVLAARGGTARRDTAMIFHTPMANAAAAQALFNMAEAAMHAVTQVDLHEIGGMDRSGVQSEWLTVLPAAFPHLTTLHIDSLSDTLPSPDQLTLLKVLDVCLDPKLQGSEVWYRLEQRLARAAPHMHEMCLSIAPYLAQLCSLSVKCADVNMQIPWSVLISGTTTTLTQLRTVCVTDALVGGVCAHAPNVTWLSCSWLDHDLTAEYAQRTWGVRTLEVAPGLRADVLSRLPRASGGLTVCWRDTRTGTPEILYHVQGRQGLSARVAQRLGEWRFATPHGISLLVDNRHNADDHLLDVRAGTQAALSQLSALPAGSRVDVEYGWESSVTVGQVQAAAAGATAAAAAVSHLQIVTHVCDDAAYGKCRDELFVALLDMQPPVAHPCVHALWLSQSYADVVWPWQSLQVKRGTPPSQLLLLPRPAAGQAEIEFMEVEPDTDTYSAQELSDFDDLFTHVTLVMGPKGVTIEPPWDGDDAAHPHMLQQALQVCSKARWRLAHNASYSITLYRWDLTPDLISVLTALPSFHGPATLVFNSCSWQENQMYEFLPAVVPHTYSTWVVDNYTAHAHIAHILPICQGAWARGEQCEKLRVCLSRGAEDGERSQVEALFRQEGLSRYMEDIEWGYRHPT